jgi:hypothetical protein
VSSSAPRHFIPQRKPKPPFKINARDSVWPARCLDPFSTQDAQHSTHCEWGTGPTRQQRRSTQHGRVARKVSHHAHNIKKSVWPLFLDGIIPASRLHDATLPMGCKSTKELPSLTSFLIHSFIASKSMPFGQKCHGTNKQARMYPDTRGQPRLG